MISCTQHLILQKMSSQVPRRCIEPQADEEDKAIIPLQEDPGENVVFSRLRDVHGSIISRWNASPSTTKKQNHNPKQREEPHQG